MNHTLTQENGNNKVQIMPEKYTSQQEHTQKGELGETCNHLLYFPLYPATMKIILYGLRFIKSPYMAKIELDVVE